MSGHGEMRPPFRPTVRAVGGPPPLAPGETRKLLVRLARRLQVSQQTVDVLFAGDDLARRLNREHRGVDRSTDVLAFPSGAAGAGPAGCEEIPRHGLHMGDILISSPTARRQAARRGHGPAHETRLLLIHGFLHLLGYDHETDDGQMRELERTLRWEVALR